jgi:ATP-dependent RNA helicase DDX55/SPB4
LSDKDCSARFSLIFFLQEVLILDEADRLLSLGFSQTVSSIMRVLPKQRRTGLFSATQTKDVDKLVRAGLRNPVLVSVKEKEESSSASATSSSTPSSLENYYVLCEPRKKLATLVVSEKL